MREAAEDEGREEEVGWGTVEEGVVEGHHGIGVCCGTTLAGEFVVIGKL